MVEKIKEPVQQAAVFQELYGNGNPVAPAIQHELSSQLKGFSKAIDLCHASKNIDLVKAREQALRFIRNEELDQNIDIPQAAQFSVLAQELMSSDLLDQLRMWAFHNEELLVSAEGKANEHVKALEQEWTETNRQLSKLNPLLMLKAWSYYKQGQLRFNLSSETLLTQIDEEILKALQLEKINPCAQAFIAYFKKTYILPKLIRELIALAYDRMVSQVMPLIQVQFRQALRQSGIGYQPLLLIYPHGKSGVMMLVLNKYGELIDESMIYPHAPDYDEEQALVHFSKLMMKYPSEHVVWVVKPETRKPIQSILDKFRDRYPDLPWQLHQLQNQISHLLVKTKTPQIEDVLKIGLFAQQPAEIWASISCLDLLNPILRNLPHTQIKSLWTRILQEHLLFSGLNIQKSSEAVLKASELFSQEDIKKIIEQREIASFASKQALQELLDKTDQEFAAIAAFIRVDASTNPLDHSPFLPSDQAFIEDLCQELDLKDCKQLLSYSAKRLDTHDDPERQRIKNLLNLYQQFHKQAQTYSKKTYPDLEKIQKHQCFYGLVTKIMPYGAFIDLGQGLEGLLHHSTLVQGMNPDLKLLLNEGDSVVVEWLNYDTKQKRLSLKYHSDYFKHVPEMQKPVPTKIKKEFQAKKVHKITENTPKKSNSLSNTPTAMALAFAKLKTSPSNSKS